MSTVDRLIRQRPELVTLRNSFGQTSLHLACDWPEAIELLLAADAGLVNLPDFYGHHPLTYSYRFQNVAATKILLRNGCSIFERGYTWWNGTRGFNVCQQYFDHDVWQAVASSLAQRRRDLLQAAQNLLSREVLGSMIFSGELPDASAAELLVVVMEAASRKGELEEYDILRRAMEWPEEEWSPVYHSWDGPVEGAEILYNAGFTCISGRDKYGRSPLVTFPGRRDPLMINWFYQKGAPLAEVEDSRIVQFQGKNFTWVCGLPNTYPSIHWLIRAVWSCGNVVGLYPYLHLPDKKINLASDSAFGKTLQIILTGELAGCVDTCGCPCSPFGCNSITILLKNLNSIQHPYFLATRLKYMQCIIHVLKDIPGWNKRSLMSKSFVRFTLFEILDLKHVCCNRDWFNGTKFCEEERKEILDENSLVIEKFEALVPRAQSGWEQSFKSWTTFWRDFCLDNIYSDPECPEDIDLTYMKSIEALGVRIDEEEVASHQCTWICYFEWPLEAEESRMEGHICPDYDLNRRGETFPS